MELKYAINKYVIFVVMILFTTYPYIFNILLGLPNEMIMNLLFAGVSLLFFFSFSSKVRAYPPPIILLSIITQCFCWSFFSIFHNDSSYITRVFFLLFTFLILVVLCSTKSIFKFGYFYNAILMLQAVIGFFAFVFVLLNLLNPLIVLERGSKFISFYGLTCSNTVVDNVMRVGGFFDEPGALASWGIFALIINKIVFNNKIVEWGLIIFLLFTFSAAYFIMLPLYFLFYYHTKIKQLIISLLLFVPIVFWTYSELEDNAYFQYMTIERFKGGNIRSKRTDYARYTKTIFEKNIYMGVGGRNLESSLEETSDNPYEILAKDGVVGYIITYLPLILLLAKFYNNKSIIWGCILLFLNYQQRPFHINEMHYFMLYFYMTIICYRYGKLNLESDSFARLQTLRTTILNKFRK